MKRVVILHPAIWYQAMGGAEIQIKYLCEYLINRKDVKVFYIYEDKRGVSIDDTLNISLRPVDNRLRNVFLGKTRVFLMNKIRKQLDDINPHIIYTRMASSWSYVAADFARINACVSVWNLASDKDVAPIKPKWFKVYDWVEYYYASSHHRLHSKIIVQNHFQKEAILRLTYNHPFLFNQATPLVNEIQLKRRFPIEIVWIGNAKMIKRPEIFVSLAEMFKNDQRFRFIMIGRTNQRLLKFILSKNLSNLVHLGELSQDQVNSRIADSTLLVNTSLFEGFSNTFVQAWMRGVPVLSFNSNPNDLLTTKRLGFMCDDLTEANIIIRKYILDESGWIKYAKRCFNYAKTHHSVEGNVSNLVDYILK